MCRQVAPTRPSRNGAAHERCRRRRTGSGVRQRKAEPIRDLHSRPRPRRFSGATRKQLSAAAMTTTTAMADTTLGGSAAIATSSSAELPIMASLHGLNASWNDFVISQLPQHCAVISWSVVVKVFPSHITPGLPGRGLAEQVSSHETPRTEQMPAGLQKPACSRLPYRRIRRRRSIR